MSLNKYFIAIVLPEPAYSEIESVKKELFEKEGLRGALRSPAHITLHRPFSWKSEKENILIESLQDFRFKSQFSIHLYNYGFFAPRVIFADLKHSPELNDLHAQLTNWCKRNLGLLNEAEDKRGFHPHVTVAFRDLKKNHFQTLKKQFELKHLDEKFSYGGFSLLHLKDRWEELAFFEQ